jgi:hypothetical protein
MAIRIDVCEPDWTTWALMAEVTLEEAVALSCNVEPDVLNNSFVFQEDYPIEVQRRLRIAKSHADGKRLNCRWVLSKRKVTLYEFAQWAKSHQLTLPDKFPQNQLHPTQVSSDKWPWGNYETKLLVHLAAAATEFWTTKYAPGNHATAPRNEEVEAWLKGRGVAARTAEAMASILRADGVPTGPRPPKKK